MTSLRVLPCTKLHRFDNDNFKYMINSTVEADLLTCCVLPNNICVLRLNTTLIRQLYGDEVQIEAFKYIVNFNQDNIKGKRKKSASKLKNNDYICEIKLNNNIILKCKTPIGGQLLELNTHETWINQSISNFKIQNSYIAIIFPTITLPDFDLIDETATTIIRDILQPITYTKKVCYDYMKGTCDRGSNCRFTHDNNNSSNNDNSCGSNTNIPTSTILVEEER